MGAATEAARLAADQLKKDRAEMEKRNFEQMEALAKDKPTPTITEVQKVLAGKAYVEPKEPAPVKAKEVEAKPNKADYETRQMQNASKK